jgi:hypothetical protein
MDILLWKYVHKVVRLRGAAEVGLDLFQSRELMYFCTGIFSIFYFLPRTEDPDGYNDFVDKIERQVMH